MTNIYIINNSKFSNNIKYMFALTQKLNPIFIQNIKLVNTLPENTYILIFNKFYNPKKDFYNYLINIIENDKGFHFLSKDNEIYITNNIVYTNNSLDIKKQNKYSIIFDIKTNKYEHIMLEGIEYSNEDIDILNDYHNDYNSIFNKNYSYDAFKTLCIDTMKDCYLILYHIRDIRELVNLPKLKFYNYRMMISHNNLDVIDTKCLENFCKQNNYKYFENKNILNKLEYLWFEKIVYANHKSELNDTTIEELNEMHKYFYYIDKYNLQSIKGEYLAYYENIDFGEINFKQSCETFPSTDIEYNPLYTKIIEARLLKIKGYDRIHYELSQVKNKTKIMNKLISMSVLCSKPPPVPEIKLNIDNSNLDILYNWFLLLMDHKPTRIIDYTSIVKQMGKNIFDIIINKNLLENNKNIMQVIIKVFDKMITFVDKDIIVSLINISTYLHKFIKPEQLKNILLLIMPFIARFDATSLFTKLLEIIYPDFIYTDLLKIFPNSPSIVDLLIHITTHFSQSDNLHCNIFEKRSQIETNLIKLLEEDNMGKYNLMQILSLSPNNFFLSYHGVSSKTLFELKCKLFKKICPELKYKIEYHKKTDKIKVCFIASMLSRVHSVYKDRHQVIKNLSFNKNFDVYFMTLDDLIPDVIDSFGNATHLKTERNLEKTKALMNKMKFDIIVYCEIGMEPYFYFLACMRLARIQINTWGHSDTSGLDTIDYFFSSKLYELNYKEAQTHYSEKLVLLNSLCTSYINPYTKYKHIAFDDRTSYGFNQSTVIYFCAQSIFKFNKVYYDYIIQIIDSNPNAILLMMKNEQQSVFIKNLNHPIVSRIHWMPSMQHKDYMKLINIADVCLDTYPFGGCNSSLEAFSLGKVVVTQPGQMINGRFTKGFYEKMGLKKYIMNSKKEYVNFAIKLADKKFREPIEKQIIEKSNVLFEDKETIIEWTDKLTELYNNSVANLE